MHRHFDADHCSATEIRQILCGGLAVLTGTDRRSRLADTLDALRAPKALPAQLSIAPQTATALLRD